jgi:hypothetical protein
MRRFIPDLRIESQTSSREWVVVKEFQKPTDVATIDNDERSNTIALLFDE